MTDLYDDLRGVVSEVMAEFKQGVIQYVPVTTAAGAAPDETGSPVAGTPVTVNATARPVSTKYVDGTNILQSDRQIAMPNDGLTPTFDGYFTIDGSRYQIIEILPRPAAGVPVSFTVIVRA